MNKCSAIPLSVIQKRAHFFDRYFPMGIFFNFSIVQQLSIDRHVVQHLICLAVHADHTVGHQTEYFPNQILVRLYLLPSGAIVRPLVTRIGSLADQELENDLIELVGHLLVRIMASSFDYLHHKRVTVLGAADQRFQAVLGVLEMVYIQYMDGFLDNSQLYLIPRDDQARTRDRGSLTHSVMRQVAVIIKRPRPIQPPTEDIPIRLHNCLVELVALHVRLDIVLLAVVPVHVRQTSLEEVRIRSSVLDFRDPRQLAETQPRFVDCCGRESVDVVPE